MPNSNLDHRRTHNLLLISKLLNQRDFASPFTLIFDTLEQTAKPLLREYLRRSKLSKTYTIFLSFETFHTPAELDHFVPCFGKNPSQISQAVNTAVNNAGLDSRCLIVIDSLNSLANLSRKPKSTLNLTAYLSSLLQPSGKLPQKQVSLIAVLHTDITIDTSQHPYEPSASSLLSYLATTVITIHSLAILLAERAAQKRSQASPVYGLAEEVEGVLVGLKTHARSLRPEHRGVIIELEHRRKSGRGVIEKYFLPTSPKTSTSDYQGSREIVYLLDDHPLFRKQKEDQVSDQALAGMTFELGLTQRQKQEREGVVLPYFDAQKGGGEGGRILYDMGVEDDFDEEEDEI